MNRSKTRLSSQRLKKFIVTWILLLTAGGLLFAFKILKHKTVATVSSQESVEAVAPTVQASQQKNDSENTIQQGFSRGRRDAPVKIEEFVDYQCPACARGHAILKDYLSLFPDKIFLTVRLFPLSNHRHAWTAARFAVCAGEQGKFWTMHDRLFQRQEEWSSLPEASVFFEDMADEMGLDRTALEQCLASDETEERIKRQKEAGSRREVSSTPTYFINDQMIVGTQGLKRFLSAYFDMKTSENKTVY